MDQGHLSSARISSREDEEEPVSFDARGIKKKEKMIIIMIRDEKKENDVVQKETDKRWKEEERWKE